MRFGANTMQSFMCDSVYTARPFEISSLAAPGWAQLPCEDEQYFGRKQTCVESAADAIRILVALLYGASLTFATVAFEKCRRFSSTSLPPHAVDGGYYDIMTVGAYAEYFGCIDIIGPMLIKMILDIPSLWAAIMQSPVKWFRLALKLRSADLFYDAYRHMIARTYWHETRLLHKYNERLAPSDFLWGHDDFSWADVSEVTGFTETELRQAYNKPMGDVDSKMEELQKDLIRLQLVPAPAFFHRRYTTFISILDALRLRSERPGRSAGSKANGRSEYLARSIYGSWVVQMLYGEVLDGGFGAHPKRGTG